MSFRARLLLVMLVLTIGIQLVVSWAVLSALKTTAMEQGEKELGVASGVAQALLDGWGQQLLDSVDLLVEDPRFREAIDPLDSAVRVDVLGEYAERMGANMVSLLDDEGRVMVSSHHDTGATDAFPDLRDQARRTDGTITLFIHDGEAFQLVLHPVRGTTSAGWLVMGFRLDEDMATALSALIRSDTHFEVQVGEGEDVGLVGSEGLRQASTLFEDAEGRIQLVVERSYETLLADYQAIKRQLAIILAISLALMLVAAILIARGVSLPLLRLVGAAKSVGRGEPLDLDRLPRQGEFGLLSSTMLKMQNDLVRREADIRKRSRQDQLTGLGNRQCANEDIEAAIATGRPFTLLRLTINHMRRINDTFGHDFGDQVLSTLAGRLADLPAPKAGAYRLSGDEFLLLLSVSHLDPLWLEDTHRRLTRAIRLDGSPVTLDCAMGEARYPEHGGEANLLLRRAEIALDRARQLRQSYQCYLHGQDERHLRHLSLVRDLQHAASNGEFSLRYQPQVSALTGRALGMEALLRWDHPRLGRIPPDEFIALAERSGLIHQLTQWVIDTGCQQLARWSEAGLNMRLGVNISAMDLQQPGLIKRVERALDRHGLRGERLCIELTESALMESPEMGARKLQSLRAMGVELAIDDYGTGYSSLAQLKRMPVQELKIDKSFVMQLVKGSEDDVIVSSTIELAHHLGLSVVAEGVEDQTVADHLAEQGCHMLQGFLISRPMTDEAATEWLRSRVGDGIRDAANEELR
ncbi:MULTISPECIES: EAL domain-containing protein [unclassified Halomonas]|uniref:putative bifunctional diguanylate cyclase/phosphodiesterase n=1 Tax=unclassified Halomonas TaxID=2609666 RepID=UPI0013B364F8|nr:MULTISPECIES: EAL domain-containing protein [unclassified Halomonas]MBR9881153.1 EAL domain-containing protein [Gammaproteobacteria bacterium]|tara:strand:+ start:880 stop:3132 length:2253 start_codon:yes stop_codon:yes gene_type:complete